MNRKLTSLIGNYPMVRCQYFNNMNLTRVFLVGFMGSGKSTVGKSLALDLGWQFIDLDSYIESKAGKSIKTIFSESGEEGFRAMEKSALQEVAKLERAIIATGGGAPCFNSNMDFMKSKGITIYLKLEPRLLRDRLMPSRKSRPLIAGKNSDELLEFIEAKLTERAPFYERAVIAVDASQTGTSAYLKAIAHYQSTHGN